MGERPRSMHVSDNSAQRLHIAVVAATRDASLTSPGDEFSLVASTYQCESLNQRSDELSQGRTLPVTGAEWYGMSSLNEAVYGHPPARATVRLLHDRRTQTAVTDKRRACLGITPVGPAAPRAGDVRHWEVATRPRPLEPPDEDCSD